MEKTFVMIKPDGLKKMVFKEVLDRFLKEGLSISNVDILSLDEKLISEHYHHLLDKPFYPLILQHMLSGPVIIMIISGENSIAKVREIIGATNPNNALPGTIRGDFGDKENITCNVIHASDSKESVKTEIERFSEYQKKFIKK